MVKKKHQSIISRINYQIKHNIIVRNIILAFSVFLIAAILVFWVLSLFTRHGERFTVPNFSGMTIEEALNASKDIELEFQITDSLYVAQIPKGAILEQYPKAGNFVKKGRRIFVTTNSFKPKMTPVPYVAGFSLRQAKNKIVGSGFVIDKISYREDLATFNVLKQYYDGKEIRSGQNILAEAGSGISLVVGLNPSSPELIIPNLTGLTITEAKNRIWEAGFNVGDIDADTNVDAENYNISKVYVQSPLAARKAMHGRSISFSISADNKKVNDAQKTITNNIAKYKEEQSAAESSASDTLTMDDVLDVMNSEIEQ